MFGILCLNYDKVMYIQHIYVFYLFIKYNAIHIFTVDYLKRLTREIAFIKYDMRQSLSLLDILVKKTNMETEANKNTEISFEDVETRFPLETTEQLIEVEEILKHRDSQHNVALVS